MKNKTNTMTGLNLNPDYNFDPAGQTFVDTSILDQQVPIHTADKPRLLYSMDESSSMAEKCEPACSKIQAARHGLVRSIGTAAKSMPEGEIALIGFNSKATTICDFVNVEEGYSKLIDAAKSLKANGNTNIPRALQAALDLLGKNAGSNDTIILMTDGHGGNGVPVAEKIKSRGVTIKVMGFGMKPSDVNEEMLRKVASVNNGKPLYEFVTDQQSFTRTMINNTITM